MLREVRCRPLVRGWRQYLHMLRLWNRIVSIPTGPLLRVALMRMCDQRMAEDVARLRYDVQ